MLTLPTIPEEARISGFVLTPVGTHTSKTMMLTELSRLIEGSSQHADYEDLRRLIVEDNVTLKDSLAARKDTFNRLAQLYALRRERPVYRALRELWPTSVEEQHEFCLSRPVQRTRAAEHWPEHDLIMATIRAPRGTPQEVS